MTSASAPRPRTNALNLDADLQNALANCSIRVNEALDAVLPVPSPPHGRVHEAMRYAVFGGGKRLRPFLLTQMASLFDVPAQQALRAAAAVEILHTYSLVHDDLPCMDDDDLRRGRATVHRAFDEATAVLAGDGLLTIAFEVLADQRTHPDGNTQSRLVKELAVAAGGHGMIGGQIMDIESETRALDAEEIVLLQGKKTGALFEFSCVAGGILGGASEAQERRLRNYAKCFGLLFQITDDLLDVLGTKATAGKAVGKDAARGKKTLVNLYGVDGARSKAAALADEAAQILAPYGSAAANLRALPQSLLDRET